jgi:hypothetical protein
MRISRRARSGNRFDIRTPPMQEIKVMILMVGWLISIWTAEL